MAALGKYSSPVGLGNELFVLGGLHLLYFYGDAIQSNISRHILMSQITLSRKAATLRPSQAFSLG